MIHVLTIGHLDPVAIRDRLAVALRPLDGAAVARVLAEFPGLKVQRRDGGLIAPWHGREDAERGEVFAAHVQAGTGCLVADRRNGRIVEMGRTASERVARTA
jgi:hypothetical protein